MTYWLTTLPLEELRS